MELGVNDCIFCAMVRGEFPYVEVFSSEHLFAFLDIGPLNKGHVLIVPKKHYPTMFEVPPEIGAELLKTMQILGKAIMQATNAGGLNVIQNNHPPAGQAVFHVHWHLVPRFEGDGILKWTPGKYNSKDEQEALGKLICNNINI